MISTQLLALRKCPQEGVYKYDTREEYQQVMSLLKGVSCRRFELEQACEALEWTNTRNILPISHLINTYSQQQTEPINSPELSALLHKAANRTPPPQISPNNNEIQRPIVSDKKIMEVPMATTDKTEIQQTGKTESVNTPPICKKCGKPVLLNNARFCMECGTPLEITCNVNTPINETTKTEETRIYSQQIPESNHPTTEDNMPTLPNDSIGDNHQETTSEYNQPPVISNATEVPQIAQEIPVANSVIPPVEVEKINVPPITEQSLNQSNEVKISASTGFTNPPPRDESTPLNVPVSEPIKVKHSEKKSLTNLDYERLTNTISPTGIYKEIIENYKKMNVPLVKISLISGHDLYILLSNLYYVNPNELSKLYITASDNPSYKIANESKIQSAVNNGDIEKISASWIFPRSGCILTDKYSKELDLLKMKEQQRNMCYIMTNCIESIINIDPPEILGEKVLITDPILIEKLIE